MSQAVLRIVKAPNQWHCECGNPIEPTQECAKMGSRILCLECLMRGLPPRPLTKAQRLIEEAKFLAWDDIAHLTHFVDGDDNLLVSILCREIEQIGNEIGLRNMPYHGREHNLFPDLNIHQLDAIASIYTQFHQSIKEANR